MEISVVLPCFNEEKGLLVCLESIKKELPDAEIIVVNNNSTDNSVSIAKRFGVIVVDELKQGYGAALRKGFFLASGKKVIMADPDNSYDFKEVNVLLNTDADLVLGNRLNKKMKKGSMPYLHKHFGTPFLNFLLSFLFKISVKDSQSGFRVIKKSSLDKMKLKSDGMELASEMLIKAKKLRFTIVEKNITYNNRLGYSKLNSLRDGLRHIKLILKEYFKN